LIKPRLLIGCENVQPMRPSLISTNRTIAQRASQLMIVGASQKKPRKNIFFLRMACDRKQLRDQTTGESENDESEEAGEDYPHRPLPS
jgi:hypothetical protein